MRILYVASDQVVPGRTGGSVHVLEVARGLAARGHEVHAVVQQTAGALAEEEADGYVVRPGRLRPATIETYDDHRMAMAFALLGLRGDGIRIADPACVAKTYPGYWAMLDDLRRGRPEVGGPRVGTGLSTGN